MFCDRVFGEKKPLYNKTLTHGICDPCFEEFRVKYENQETVKPNAQKWRNRQINTNAQTI